MKMQYDWGKMKEDVYAIAQRLGSQLASADLREMFCRCFVNTVDTTVQPAKEWPFVITGDIPAMWLRDSASQVTHYLPFLRECASLRQLVRGMVLRQAYDVCHDPYANAFNACENGREGVPGDQTEGSPLVWERKYEVDSLCSMIDLTDAYYRASGDADALDGTVRDAFTAILDLWEREQHHEERSPYRFQRFDCPPSDTLTREGKGSPVGYTGMTWSGFRPSDDACVYGYLIPANMYAVSMLGRMAALCREVWQDEPMACRAERLADEIDRGIQTYGIVEHEQFGPIYAYETDGLGNHLLMDDANVPSLLSIPLLGYRGVDDPVYQNTRRFVLSEQNPYCFSGSALRGIGSPHTKSGYVWPIALCVQALTSTDSAEIDKLVSMLSRTTAGTGYMHESVCADDPEQYSRPWFAWANSLFARMICEKYLKV